METAEPHQRRGLGRRGGLALSREEVPWEHRLLKAVHDGELYKEWRTLGRRSTSSSVGLQRALSGLHSEAPGPPSIFRFQIGRHIPFRKPPHFIVMSVTVVTLPISLCGLWVMFLDGLEGHRHFIITISVMETMA
jgi:hypothetical protein